MLIVLILVLLLVFFHEIGHVLAAKLTGLTIAKYGFRVKPYPHFYVSTTWPKTNVQKYIYFLGF